MSFIAKKLKVCPECESKEEIDYSENVIDCDECGYYGTAKQLRNYFKLRTEFLADDFIEKFNEKTRLGQDVREVERAIENYRDEQQEE